MNIVKNIIRQLLAVAIIAMAFGSCKKFQGEYTVPSYIHIDKVDVVPQAQNAPSPEAGFYTSAIDCVQIICYFEGDQSETNLGAYQLPCTVPVLHQGRAKYVHVVPVVKQNGMSETRIAYPFLKRIELSNIDFVADSTVDLGTLQCNYYTRAELNVLTEDYFEPTTFSTHFDSVVQWVANDPENACTGQGYGLITIPDTVMSVNFAIKDEFDIPNSYLYLEMDYQTDVELYVHMLGFERTTNTNATSKSVMCMVPKDKWNKIYINLSRTWSQFYYHTPIRIYFQAANPEKKTAHVKIDNVKILTTK